MNMILKKLLLPVILLVMLSGFWVSPEFQKIAAGVAIFLFGMLMLEDGFRLFSGGFLERILARATGSVTRSLLLGILSTSIMQSSSLVSVITISFLSAGLITLLAGVGIVFGANLGTTTGAWLVAGFGMKVNIAVYAMPLLAIGVVLVFQSSKYLRGLGYVLAGLGFLFLGIHYMKEGFETFRSAFDLTQLAMTGVLGLIVYTLFGTLATVVMQSSHATMVLVITALAAQQISYENALALAIGANIGTTITAILGSLTANYQGKQLALAHLVFNLATAAVALGLITPLREAVEFISGHLGIAEEDFTLKLAVFHSLFNSLGIILMLPLLGRLIQMIERVIREPASDLSEPKYLTEAVDEFPATIESAMQKEIKHLYDNAVELITHGLNLHRHELFAAKDIEALVASSRTPVEFDIDQRYEWRIKTLYSAILEFATRATSKALPEDVVGRIYQLRDAAERTVRAVKAIKHLRRNTTRYTVHAQGAVTELYDSLRTDIARVLVEIERLDRAAPESRSRLWLDDELQNVDVNYKHTNARIEDLIRSDKMSAEVATSFLNDSNYAYDAVRELIEAARSFYAERDSALAEVEQILAIDEDETDRVA